MKFIKVTAYFIADKEYFNMPCVVNIANVNYFQQSGQTGSIHMSTTFRFNDKTVLSVRESEEEILELIKTAL